MEYSFIDVEVTLGFSTQYKEQGYQLSNGVILIPSERDALQNYIGVVGMDGIYLCTGKRYRPIYDSTHRKCAFEDVV